MRYIVDAQLPRSLVKWLMSNEYNAVHTLDLPGKNYTTDNEIIRISTLDEVSVVVSKDKDFPEQRIIRGVPTRLLWITTGNIKNSQLLKMFKDQFSRIDQLFVNGNKFIELSNEAITIHD